MTRKYSSHLALSVWCRARHTQGRGPGRRQRSGQTGQVRAFKGTLISHFSFVSRPIENSGLNIAGSGSRRGIGRSEMARAGSIGTKRSEDGKTGSVSTMIAARAAGTSVLHVHVCGRPRTVSENRSPRTKQLCRVPPDGGQYTHWHSRSKAADSVLLDTPYGPDHAPILDHLFSIRLVHIGR